MKSPRLEAAVGPVSRQAIILPERGYPFLENVTTSIISGIRNCAARDATSYERILRLKRLDWAAGTVHRDAMIHSRCRSLFGASFKFMILALASFGVARPGLSAQQAPLAAAAPR